MVSGGTASWLLSAMEMDVKKDSTRETQSIRKYKLLKAIEIGILDERMNN